ncbi:hypothetical protein Tco_1292589 [Tanacetum coccineum]
MRSRCGSALMPDIAARSKDVLGLSSIGGSGGESRISAGPPLGPHHLPPPDSSFRIRTQEYSCLVMGGLFKRNALMGQASIQAVSLFIAQVPTTLGIPISDNPPKLAGKQPV